MRLNYSPIFAGLIVAVLLTMAAFERQSPLAAADSDLATAGLATEVQSQYVALQHDLRLRSRSAKFADQTFRKESLILATDRDPLDIVLRRTGALLADLKQMPQAPNLASLENELGKLQAEAGKVDVKDVATRRQLFEKVCQVRRRIAFSNPLLDFDKILFIKRHRPAFNHMCDQYYGITARPGGSLYVLANPFGAQPQIRDVLKDAVVEKGRLKGQKLVKANNPPPIVNLSFDGMGNLRSDPTEEGSFCSPALSYDTTKVLFAYVECTGEGKHFHHTDPSRGHWAEGRCYHIFRVNLDGTGLEQLTDGTWNDFDPCFMPDGRIVFNSERRGGYLRCGRVCPIYTLHDMAPDGSDIRCLSHHETNEWHPSVTHDGMIIYTRWDYVDRYGCIAHMPWITTPDGRDARALHGNFSQRNLRPDMELSIRAIPDSRRFVATAAPHHGQAFGSLILIDPRVQDDDAMGPVQRLTPDVGFPESQGGSESYGTPWPLNEDYHLCVYDPAMEVPELADPPVPANNKKAVRKSRGNYGIYLVDSFGNKELLYHDPTIACLSPIPVKQQPKPPMIPQKAQPVVDGKPAEGTLAVINVYDSLKPWPEGTKIKALRIFQVMPMSVPSGGPPHEMGLRLPDAGDSVNPARSVLGTVPVEADGSAHFSVPAHKGLFFQALDEKGLAVQSMRSSTYLQAGERLVCQGCHEPRHRIPGSVAAPGSESPKSAAGTPLAMRRAPSQMQPDVDGSNPFSYPRLVQPVLDRHCVKCHAENPGKAPPLDRTIVAKGNRKWFNSYVSLAPKYGFWNYGNSLRTIPGKFGAQASKLYPLLAKGHHDVKLSEEEMHRITLWLDTCSLFYGVYEREGGEAQLRGEIARPTLE